MWNDRFARLCDVGGRACFDPATLAIGSLAATAVGGGLSAAGTIAGGNAAAAAGQMQKTADYYQAEQDDTNAAQEFASGQRKMLDTQDKTRLLLSTLKATAASNGTNTAVGSPVDIAGAIAKRGSYHAALDMFNGASAATGLRNKAAGERYSGDAAATGGQLTKDASFLSAAGTIAGSAGSMLKTYGGWQYPQNFKTA
jgi:hypothetical protein